MAAHGAAGIFAMTGVGAPIAGWIEEELDEQDAAAAREARVPELRAALTLYNEVWEETNDPFLARDTVRAAHWSLFSSDPAMSRLFDTFTVGLWVDQGGDWAGAESKLRGFEFETVHHNQCVYDVKMAHGSGVPAGAPRAEPWAESEAGPGFPPIQPSQDLGKCRSGCSDVWVDNTRGTFYLNASWLGGV